MESERFEERGTKNRFSQYPLIQVFSKRKLESRYLIFLYGNSRNWWYMVVFLIGGCIFLFLGLPGVVSDWENNQWRTTNLVSALLLWGTGLLSYFDCVVQRKLLIEVSMILSYSLVHILSFVRSLLMEELDLYPIKRVAIFDLSFFLLLRPRLIVFLPIFVIITAFSCIFLPVFFWNRVDDYRYFVTLAGYLLCETMLMVFLYAYEKINRNAFVKGVVLAEREQRYDIEHKKSAELLKNILPVVFIKPIFNGVLNRNPHVIRTIQDASILSCDIVNFTKICSNTACRQIVNTLDRYFGIVDELIKELSLEKVKTVGDAVLVVGGMQTCSRMSEHVPKMVLLGISIIESVTQISEALANENKDGLYFLREEREEEIEKMPESFSKGFQVRVGIATGLLHPVVFGEQHLSFDVFGKVVREVDFLEANSIPQGVHVSNEIFELTKDEFSYKTLLSNDERYEDLKMPKTSDLETNVVVSSLEEEDGLEEEIVIESPQFQKLEKEVKGLETRETYVIEYQPELLSVVNPFIRSKLTEVIDSAMEVEGYIQKREMLITSSRGSRFDIDHKKNRKKKKTVVDEIEVELKKQSKIKKKIRKRIQMEEDDYSSDKLSGNPIDLIFLSEREKRNYNHPILHFFDQIFSTIRDIRNRKFFLIRCCNFCAVFHCCCVKFWFDCCCPCFSLIAVLCKCCCRCCFLCINPISSNGWFYCCLIFCPCTREKEYIMEVFNSTKWKYFMIFFFNMLQRGVVIIYFLSTENYEQMYKVAPGFAYSIYLAVFVQFMSILFLIITEIPIYIKTKKRIKQRIREQDLPATLRPLVTKKNKSRFFLKKKKVYPLSYQGEDHSTKKMKKKRKRSRKKIKVVHTYETKRKLFDVWLYRPLFMYPIVIINFMFFPLDLILCMLSPPNIWQDLHFQILMFFNVYINWVQGFHVCLRILGVAFLFFLQICHLTYNLFIVDTFNSTVTTKSSFLIQEIQYEIIVIILFLFWTISREVIFRGAFDKKKQIMKNNRKVLEKKWKNEMIIHSVLPKEIVDGFVQEKKGGYRNERIFNQRISGVVGGSMIHDIALGYVKVSHIAEAFQSSNISNVEIVSLLVDLFNEFDQIVINKCYCQKIKSIQEAYLFIAKPTRTQNDQEHEEKTKKRMMKKGTFVSLKEERTEREERRKQDIRVNICRVIYASQLCIAGLQKVKKKHQNLQFDDVGLKIGVHFGSVSSGVVGNIRFVWDIWGDSLNTAARLSQNADESGLNEIQILQRVADMFEIETRNRKTTFLKGKGEMVTAEIALDSELNKNRFRKSFWNNEEYKKIKRIEEEKIRRYGEMFNVENNQAEETTKRNRKRKLKKVKFGKFQVDY